MIFTKEQVRIMNGYKTEYESIKKQQADLFSKKEDRFIFIRSINKDTGESTRVFYPTTPNQKMVASSPLYQHYQRQMDQIKEKIKPMIPVCIQTLKENFHFVVDDIKQYGESIFEIDKPLLSTVYQNVQPRAHQLGIDITRDKYIYYLSEFYINHYDDIDIVLDTEICMDDSSLLNQFIVLLRDDQYIASIIEKQLEKNRQTKN